MSYINNAILKAHYSNLTVLFDLLKPTIAQSIELLKENDNDDYRKLLKTTVVSANKTQDFPHICEENQELLGNIKRERLGFDTVSTV
jgi:hypothetical protein